MGGRGGRAAENGGPGPLGDGGAGAGPSGGTTGRGVLAAPLHRVRRRSVLLALLTPLALAGLSALTADPDWATPGLITGVLLLSAALLVLMTVRPNGWWLLPGILLGITLLALPGEILKGEVLLHRGVRTDVVVTTAHHGKAGRDGRVHWTCDIRRADGKPLAHAVLKDPDCWGEEQVGTTETVVVDPEGWTAPASVDEDYSGLGAGIGVVGAAAALWVLLVLVAARRTLRASSPR